MRLPNRGDDSPKVGSNRAKGQGPFAHLLRYWNEPELCAGLIIIEDGPPSAQSNVRFAEPETQAFVARVQGDLLEAIAILPPPPLSLLRSESSDYPGAPWA